MSKNFIPTVHKGKAHEADIFNVQYSKFATITTSGDGYLKVWKNYLNEGDLPEDNVQSKFLTKAGLHHTSFLEFKDLETKKSMLFIGTISFTGELFIEKYDVEKNEFENDLDLKKILNFDTMMESQEDQSKSYHNIIEKNTFYLIKFLPMNLNNKIPMDKLLLTTVDSKVIVLDLMYQSETSTFDVTKVETLQITEKSLGFKTLQQSETPFITCMDASNKLSNVLTLGFNTSHAPDSESVHTDPAVQYISDFKAPMTLASTAVSLCMTSKRATSLATTRTTHTQPKDTNTFTHTASCLAIDFNETDEFIATAGLDSVVNVWETITRERVGRIKVACSDIENNQDIMDKDPVTLETLTYPGIMDVKYIHKNSRGGLGGAKNEGLVVAALDRGIRWFREAGGI
ncbi:hypothetical protein ACO0OL_001016 [Hanseniaspora opuntiae]